MLVSVLTGFAAGAIHVVGGIDHVVAMTPVGLARPRLALRDGLYWGVGHSTGTLVLCSFAIAFKDLAHIQRMSTLAELLVGIGLLVVGIMAVRTSLGLDIHTHIHTHDDNYAHEHVHLHVRGRRRHGTHQHAITSLGILHGFAGASHLLAVIPALALPRFAAIAYMASYLIGSIIAMGAVVLAISFASLSSGKRTLPILFGFTGGLSIATGFFWIHKTSAQIF